MKYCTVCGVLVGAIVGAGAVGLATNTLGDPPKETPKVPGHDTKKTELPKQPAMSEEQMMAEMTKLATPGEQHKAIAKFAGTWKGHVESVDPMTGKTETSDGTMVSTAVLDGRWLRQEWTGTYGGQPFKGIGYWGYDNAKKEYTSMWTDTWSTSWMNFTGQYDAATKSYTSRGTCDSPMGKMEMREVVTVKNDNEHTFDMYMPGPDGKEVKNMTITYTRQK